jgi:hypothetical protein
MSCPMINALFSLFGAAIGAFIGHRFSVIRARNDRKRAFCAFIGKWKTSAGTPYRGGTIIGLKDLSGLKTHDIMCTEFAYQIEHVRNIWGKNSEFNKLCADVINFHSSGKNTELDSISDNLQKLLDFCLKH